MTPVSHEQKTQETRYERDIERESETQVGACDGDDGCVDLDMLIADSGFVRFSFAALCSRFIALQLHHLIRCSALLCSARDEHKNNTESGYEGFNADICCWCIILHYWTAAYSHC